MFGWLFPKGPPRRRSRKWGDTNIIRDIGESRGAGGRQGRGGGRRSCDRCPNYRAQIQSLKEQNAKLREKIRRLEKERNNKKAKAPAGDPGSPEWYQAGYVQILNILNTNARFSDYHIPRIREVTNGMLGMKTGWDSSKGRATRG